MNLRIQKIDPYQFAGKDFTVVVTLPDAFPDIARRTSNLPLKVDVCYEDEVAQFDALDRNYNPNLLEVKSNASIDRSRRGLLTLRLNEPSVNHNNRRFVIRFMAFTLEGDISSIVGYSTPITVVRYRLKIQEEFADHGSYIWMKDVGGKDKSIDLQVSLVDVNDALITNRRVPLRVALLYSNGTLVPQQDILQLSPETQLVIGSTGSTRIKCRINEVSSRHQGQLFQVQVSPDFEGNSPLADISPARSVPVEVKSKINISHKRKLQAMSDANSLASGSGGGGGGAAGLGEAEVHAAGTAALAAAADYASILPLSSVLSGVHGHGADGDGLTPSVLGTSSGGRAAAAALALLSQKGLTPRGAATGQLGEPTLSRHPSAVSMSGASVQRPPSIDVSPRGTPSQPLALSHVTPSGPTQDFVVSPAVARAIREVLSYAEAANSSLSALQWTPIGHMPPVNPETGLPTLAAPTADRTLYTMPNPNRVITVLTDRYQQQVRPHVAILERCLSVSVGGAPSGGLRGRSGAGSTSATNIATPSAPMSAAPSAAPSSTLSTASSAAVSPRLPAGQLDTMVATAAWAGRLSDAVGVPVLGSTGDEQPRVVYTGKCVFAAQTLPDGAEREHLLGLAAFTRQDNQDKKHRFIGFYASNDDGRIVFRDPQDLLALLASDAQGSSSRGRGRGLGAEEVFQLGRAVAELEGLISDPALEAASVTLRRAAGEGPGAFDLTPLQSVLLPWSDYERLYVQIN